MPWPRAIVVVLLLLGILVSNPVSADDGKLSLKLNPTQETFQAGQFPQFKVVVSNDTTKTVKFCRYKLDYRLKAAMVIRGPKNYEAQPFVSQRWEDLRKRDIVTLEPGDRIEHVLSFQEDPVFGIIRRAKQPPIIPRSNSIVGFEPGTYTFNTALSSKVGIYIGRDGVFDGRLDARRVPEKWPGYDIGCYAGLIEDTATVIFQ